MIVLEQGKIVEAGGTRQVFERPAHDYTRRLLASIPGQSPVPENVKFEAASYG